MVNRYATLPKEILHLILSIRNKGESEPVDPSRGLSKNSRTFLDELFDVNTGFDIYGVNNYVI